MTLSHPIWLLLAVPLGASLWLGRFPSRLVLALRLALLLLVLLALGGLALRLSSRAGTVVVIADRSLSMPPDAEAAQKEAIRLIRSGRGDEDRLAVVSFGRTAAVEQAPQARPFAGFTHEVGRDASNLADGIETALALLPDDAPGKIVLLSDGRWTGQDPIAAASRAAGRGVAIDYRCLQRASANDLAIARVDAPSTATPGESFLITAWVRAPVRQTCSFELWRGKRRLSAGSQRLVSGLNRLTFRDQAAGPGTLSYNLRVSGKGKDPVPENNTARFLVGVQGPRPLLLVTAAPRSGLARLLRGGGLQVKVAAPETCRWSLEELSKFAAVLLENVPAEKIGGPGMEVLAAWVRETGAGLMLTGGRQAYGPGGYYRSPLEPVLPVSMELRQQHRKLALAMVVALDRSGSMAVGVGGGKVKMDLANLGTVQVLDLLGPLDEFGVLAVDTEAHVIQRLAPLTDKGRLRSKILRINSQGGGIFVDVALAAAHRMIRSARAETRHIILFADAADAEQPGNYRDLIEQCRKENITVSAIGLGTPADKDAELLRDIARRGGGRCLFTARPEELPRLFAQDTFAVARSTFLDEVTTIRPTAGLTSLTGKRLVLPRPIGGYNLCYLRAGANLATVTVDEYKAPVVAAWQAGAGRVLCYTGEADGKYTGPIAHWEGVGGFFSSLARWTAGAPGQLPGGMLLTQEVKNGMALVQLHLDPERATDPFEASPQATTLRGDAGAKPRAETARMHWISADTLALDIPLHGSETAVTAVAVPGHGRVVLPPVCLPYSPEFRPPEAGEGLPALQRLARATGGKERVALAEVWKDLPRRPRRVEIGSWLLLSAVGLLLVEVLERRTGLLGKLRRPGRVGDGVRTSQPVPVAQGTAPPRSAETPTAAPSREEPEAGGLLGALRQARQRARRPGETKE